MKMDKKPFCRCRESRSFHCYWENLKWEKYVSLRQRTLWNFDTKHFSSDKSFHQTKLYFCSKDTPKGFKQRFTSASASSSCYFIFPLFLTLCGCWGFSPPSLIKNKARWAAITRSPLLLVQHLHAAPGCPWGCLTGHGVWGGLTSAVSFGNRGNSGRNELLSFSLHIQKQGTILGDLALGHLLALGAVTTPGPWGLAGCVREPTGCCRTGWVLWQALVPCQISSVRTSTTALCITSALCSPSAQLSWQ